jgi:hypothetical protein
MTDTNLSQISRLITLATMLQTKRIVTATALAKYFFRLVPRLSGYQNA